MPDHLNDTLTDADGTNVTAHTPETGGAWSVVSSLDDTLKIASNRAYSATANGSGFGVVENAATPGGADQYTEVDIHDFNNQLQQLIIKVRTNHFVVYDFSTSQWSLLYLGQGYFGAVTDSGRFSSGNDYTVRAEEIGNILYAKVGGVQVWSYDVGTNQPGLIDSSVGKSGFGFHTTSGTTSGVHVSAIRAGTTAVTATSHSVTGPGVVLQGRATPPDSSTRDLVGGKMSIVLGPTAGTLATDITFSLSSDGAGDSFSSSTLTIPAGSNSGDFRFTAGSAGPRTITATETTSHGFGVKTLSTYSSPNLVAFNGDSRLDMIGGTPMGVNCAPYVVQQIVGNRAAVYDFAGAGATIDNCETTAVSSIDTLLSSVPGISICPLMGGGNNVSNTASGEDAATIWSKIQTYASNRRSAGADYVILSSDMRRTGTLARIGSGGSSDPTAFNAVIDALGALILAGWPTYADGVCDPRSCANLDPSNGSYGSANFADGTHQTNGGANDLASVLAQPILNVLDRVVSSGGVPLIGGGLVR